MSEKILDRIRIKTSSLSTSDCNCILYLVIDSSGIVFSIDFSVSLVSADRNGWCSYYDWTAVGDMGVASSSIWANFQPTCPAYGGEVLILPLPISLWTSNNLYFSWSKLGKMSKSHELRNASRGRKCGLRFRILESFAISIDLKIVEY